MKTILIDLDGVLNEYVGSFDKDFIPPIKHGAKVFLSALAEKFHWATKVDPTSCFRIYVSKTLKRVQGDSIIKINTGAN